MSGVSIAGDTSGSIILAAPAIAGGNTATLPAATGTVMVSGNMPAFSAYRSGNQTFSSNTWTKIAFNTEEFDTASCFDSTTNYRFTPTVAGYYQVNAILDLGGSGVSFTLSAFYKNGSQFKNIGFISNSAEIIHTGSYLIYMNGTTDYLEVYAYITASSPTVYGASTAVAFSGFLARTA